MKLCDHESEHKYRMTLPFDDELRVTMKRNSHWAPFTHQVVWCSICSSIVGQEDNDIRKAFSMPFQALGQIK